MGGGSWQELSQFLLYLQQNITWCYLAPLECRKTHWWLGAQPWTLLGKLTALARITSDCQIVLADHCAHLQIILSLLIPSDPLPGGKGAGCLLPQNPTPLLEFESQALALRTLPRTPLVNINFSNPALNQKAFPIASTLCQNISTVKISARNYNTSNSATIIFIF